MDISSLAAMALKAREGSYCPYSEFAVGAALLTRGGKIYLGANIENAGHSGTVCAERVAFLKAVSEGEKQFDSIAIAGGKKDSRPESFCAPCGVCRQVMAEFCAADFKVIFVKSESETEIHDFSEIFPFPFGPDNL